MRLDLPGINGSIEVYMSVLRAICGNTTGKSLIDLGCCFAPNTPRLGFEKRTYVDIVDRVLDHTAEQQYFRWMDILNIDTEIFRGFYDVAIASDVIEHLLESDGRKLLGIMERISRKQIIFTPTTEIFKMVDLNNQDPEAHRSLWSPDMIPGWASIVFPDFHPTWNGGAFWAWKCQDIEKDFERVKNAIQL